MGNAVPAASRTFTRRISRIYREQIDVSRKSALDAILEERGGLTGRHIL